MGNCIRHESPMQWGGDDWGSIFTVDDLPAETKRHVSATHNNPPPASTTSERPEIRLFEDQGICSSSSSSNSKVKIKITKKQLQELLGRVELKEMTVHQVMLHLQLVATGTGGGAASDHHAWQPALQSIPEAS